MENAAAFLCRKSVLSYGQYYLIKFQGFPPKVRSRTNKGKNEWISRAETGHRAILPYCRDSREIGNSFRPKSWEGAGSISRAEVVPFREYSGAQVVLQWGVLSLSREQKLEGGRGAFKC